ncbi:hypothetical protein [Pedobacter frigiditerrae]|uniref:hypothetical protein n=1 Tax=Pedobacter frigiditerrae TaxID=2530452 RepID=UPI00292F8F49|nr:hypothetical protein [Pedobacter frigiditerrae]
MRLLQNPPDGGSLYTETNLQQLFPEPLNALTSCFFLGIAIYWTFKLWRDHKAHPFLTYCLVLLYIGGIGGTTYHAFRKWNIFIMMDWLLIMLLCVSAGVYFLAKLIKWYFAISVVIAYLTLQFYFRNTLAVNNIQLFLNINYAMMASLVLLPVLGYLIKTKWKDGKWVGYALIAFVIALTFRIADKWEWLNTGTHFLWHTFGAIASACMFYYIYLTGFKDEIGNRK